ncbi:MAG: hypothetical protein ACRENS_05185 [Candidatus Eiseniibacteriota bacterium]
MSSRKRRASELPRPAARPAATEGPETPPLFPGFGDLMSWKEPFLLPLVAMLMARIVMAYLIPEAAEDAYITFRYARFFAEGHGLVFNPGQHVMGFTSPLWTLWMSLGFLFHLSPIVWSRVSAIAADAITLVTVAAMLRASVSRASAWCFGAFFAGWPYFSAMTASGMENGVMFMLMAVSAATLSRRHALGPVCLAALALTRPEGFVVACLLAVTARRRDALLAGAIVAAGLIPLALYYGTVIPQSVFAKSHLYGTPGPLAGKTWWGWLIPRPFERIGKVVEYGHLVVIAVLFTPALVKGVARLWAVRTTGIAQLALAGLMVWLSYALLGVAYFYWYLLVPLAGLTIVAAAGLPSLVRGAPIYVAALALIVSVYVDAMSVYFSRTDIEFMGFGGAADYLNAHARSGQKVLLEPIGIVGYHCPLVVVDEIGLVSPQVAQRRLQGAGWYTDVVSMERPDWLVVRAGTLASGAAFAGAGAPFRSAEERLALMQTYAADDTIEPSRADQALVILHRR